jgi:hypothetical protein
VAWGVVRGAVPGVVSGVVGAVVRGVVALADFAALAFWRARPFERSVTGGSDHDHARPRRCWSPASVSVR